MADDAPTPTQMAVQQFVRSQICDGLQLDEAERVQSDLAVALAGPALATVSSNKNADAFIAPVLQIAAVFVLCNAIDSGMPREKIDLWLSLLRSTVEDALAKQGGAIAADMEGGRLQ